MKILITVKTYPALSTKYGETVCTAGITEEGKWIRIYPLPFRKLDYDKRFNKYDWVELELKRNTNDFRPESFRPVNYEEIKDLGKIEADGDTWEERRKYVMKNVYTNLAKLIKEAKDKNICTSLAVFKPTKIHKFTYEKTDREWDSKKINFVESEKRQLNLFESENEEDIENFEVVDKLPYKFKYEFEDDSGKIANLMIEDWETGMLYWNSLKSESCNGDEMKACEKVKEKYFDNFVKTKDVYFYLGTTKQHHYTAPNPFVIIGAFYPKPITQPGLFG
ncbi:MAG: hypothetical protein KBA66_04115 [Leptospiraceae bacterium]|nr:hypothetical protein [Leptospiraceae bacterium]